jgi:hypothetical protein
LLYSNNLKFFFKLKKNRGKSFGKNILCSKINGLKTLYIKNNFLLFKIPYYVSAIHFNIKKQYSIIKNKYNFFSIIPKLQFSLPGQIIYSNYLNELYLLLIVQANCKWDRSQKIIFSNLFVPIIYFLSG